MILTKKSKGLTYVYAYNGEAGQSYVQLSEFMGEIEKIENINQNLFHELPVIEDLSENTVKRIDEIVSMIFLR